MITEENVVYQILDLIRASQSNADEPIDEREIRALMKARRPRLIEKAFMGGTLVDGIEFQDLGPVTLSGTFTFPLPPFIQLTYFQGIKITTPSGYNIPVMNYESYMLEKGNPITKYQPKAYIQHQLLTVYPGLTPINAMGDGAGHEYDWTTSPYPLSPELIDVLKEGVIYRDLQVGAQAKVDEVSNLKVDNIRYHDQGKID
jgi:hypothetical protein